MNKKRLVFLIGMILPVGAFAQPRMRPPETNWEIAAGLGSVYSPVFEGAKEYSLSIVPDVRIKYKNKFFASIPEGFGYNVISRKRGENGWRAGPIGFLKFARSEDDSSPFSILGETEVLNGMGDVGMTFEAGGFTDYKYDWFNARLGVRYGIGGHSGTVGDFRIYYADNFGPLRFTIGPSIEIASSKYNQAYFGIDSKQSANTGFAEYKASAGIVSYGIGGFVLMPLSYTVAVSLFWRYSALGSVARSSPLLKQHGQNTQFTMGLGASYVFRFD